LKISLKQAFSSEGSCNSGQIIGEFFSRKEAPEISSRIARLKNKKMLQPEKESS
jgi:hypothetical protein